MTKKKEEKKRRKKKNKIAGLMFSPWDTSHKYENGTLNISHNRRNREKKNETEAEKDRKNLTRNLCRSDEQYRIFDVATG